MSKFDNTSDVIDSRDIIARIEELESQLDDPEYYDDAEDSRKDDQDELEILQRLEKDGRTSSDWEYGETLVRDDYFETYAKQMADDIGVVPNDLAWPLCHIDWEAATEALQQDYFEVDFDGVTYWIRS